MEHDMWFECPVYKSETDDTPVEAKPKPTKKSIIIDLTEDESDIFNGYTEGYTGAISLDVALDIGISFSEDDFDPEPSVGDPDSEPLKQEPLPLSREEKEELYEMANDGPSEWRRIFNRGDGECCIYFVTMGEKEGPIKIGFSTRKASTRIKEYKAGNAYRLKVYCAVTVKDPKAWETVMHNIFYERRMLEEGRSNEWFNITKTDVDLFFSCDEVKYAFINDDKDKAASFPSLL